MRRIVFRPECYREYPARSLMHALEELALLPALAPMGLHIDQPPVFQPEA